jgi:peptidyl-dipeptidase Dcp
LGYENFAAFKLADSMAGTPAKARALLEEVWEPARKRALEERGALQALIARQGANFRLAPWDWRYYAEKLRQERYAFDAEQLQPYFQLSNLIDAAFFTPGKLFGFRSSNAMTSPSIIPMFTYGRSGAKVHAIGYFYGDYFARPANRVAPGCPASAISTGWAAPRRMRKSAHHRQQRQFQQKRALSPCPLTMR